MRKAITHASAIVMGIVIGAVGVGIYAYTSLDMLETMSRSNSARAISRDIEFSIETARLLEDGKSGKAQAMLEQRARGLTRILVDVIDCKDKKSCKELEQLQHKAQESLASL